MPYALSIPQNVFLHLFLQDFFFQIKVPVFILYKLNLCCCFFSINAITELLSENNIYIDKT